MSRLAIGVAASPGASKRGGASEDFAWHKRIGRSGVVVVVGDFAPNRAAAKVASRVGGKLDESLERLWKAGVVAADLPTALVYELANDLYVENAKMGGASCPRCSVVAFAIQHRRIWATQVGDVRLAIEGKDGPAHPERRLFFPGGSNWMRATADPGLTGDSSYSRARPDAIGLDEIPSPLSLPGWTGSLEAATRILCYTDGFEDGWTPARTLEVLKGEDPGDPRGLAATLVETSSCDRGDDDITLVVVEGFAKAPDPLAKLRNHFEKAREDDRREATSRLAEMQRKQGEWDRHLAETRTLLEDRQREMLALRKRIDEMAKAQKEHKERSDEQVGRSAQPEQAGPGLPEPVEIRVKGIPTEVTLRPGGGPASSGSNLDGEAASSPRGRAGGSLWQDKWMRVLFRTFLLFITVFALLGVIWLGVVVRAGIGATDPGATNDETQEATGGEGDPEGGSDPGAAEEDSAGSRPSG